MGGEMMPSFREEAMALLEYDDASGVMRWRVRRNSFGGKVKPGVQAGTPQDGYLQVRVLGQTWRVHRLAWLFVTGEPPPKGFEIDHINGDRSDNRWANLRLVTRGQNNMNVGVTKANRSGTRGVSWESRRKRWLARIKVDGRVHHLGEFDDINDAIAARKAGEALHCGQYARAA